MRQVEGALQTDEQLSEWFDNIEIFTFSSDLAVVVHWQGLDNTMCQYQGWAVKYYSFPVYKQFEVAGSSWL